MDISVETIQMAEDILSSIDANEEFMEHHGVKGQKHGVRRYQNDDGSLTALGRQHYGIFGRLRSRFNPAERGYRAAVKQQQQQQKIAVKKAKYAGDIKKMMKKRKYFTDEEIERQIDTDTRLQQKRNRLNELMRADKIKRKEEKIAEKERKEAIKESKIQQELQKEAIKSQEKQHKLEQKTLLDVQKQKDKAQAEREQAQREYQTQQQIAKGKTLLGRLQKGAQMTAAIMGIASNVSKTAGVLKEMGFIPKKVDEAAKKINEAKEAVKKAVPEKPKGNNEATKEKPHIDLNTSGWDPNSKQQWKTEKPQKVSNGQAKKQLDSTGWDPNLQQKWSPVKETSNNNKLNGNASKWDANVQHMWKNTIVPNSPPSHELKNKYDGIFGKVTPTDKSTSTSREKNYSEEKRLSLKEAAEEGGAKGFKDKVFSSTPAAVAERAQRRKEAKAQKEREAQAKQKAQDIKERWNRYYQAQAQKYGGSPELSDTAKFIKSLSANKLASILSGNVQDNIPSGVNLATAMSTRIGGSPTSYKEEFNKRIDWQRKQRYGHIKHEDILEDAGEVEDAE